MAGFYFEFKEDEKMEKLLTLKEAQQRLAVSASMMNQLVHAQGFPALKIGRQWRVEPSRLGLWIKDRMQEKDENCLV